jgi:hypothetical protein
MDMNVYLVEWWAKERLGEIRAAVAREQLAESLRRRPPFRVALGRALTSLGRKLGYFLTNPFSRSLARACRVRFDGGP